jgi:hypothetical protein
VIAWMNSIVADCLYLIPILMTLAAYRFRAEQRRIDGRIDAVLELLKKRGIDLLDPDLDPDFD